MRSGGSWSFCKLHKSQKRPYMRATFIMVIMLVMSAALWAQGDSPDCYQLVNGTDTGCSVTSCDGTQSGCSSYSFLATCTGTYYFDVWTTCTNGDCGDCRTCCYLYESDHPISNCHTSNCDNGDCNETCTVTLQTNHRYTLYVCLYHCPDEEGCANCNLSCTAHACLRFGQTATCY